MKKNTTKETSISVKQNNILETKTSKDKIEIISHEYKKYGTIEVIIKNNTGKDLEYVKIVAKCYDKDGNNLGNKSAGSYNINTQDTYKISIWAGTDVKKYTLSIDEYK